MNTAPDFTTVDRLQFEARKEIKPVFCRETRQMEYWAYLDGELVSVERSNLDAQIKLDEVVYDLLTMGLARAAWSPARHAA